MITKNEKISARILFSAIFFGVYFVLGLWAKSRVYLPFDLEISRFVQSLNFPGLKMIANGLTYSGWSPYVYIWIGTIIFALILLKKRLEALFVLLLVILDFPLFTLSANSFNRPRPPADLVDVLFELKVGGYPSGHILLVALVFGFIAYLFIKSNVMVLIKRFFLLLFAVLIFSMSVARIYSGQHWPTDIIGGILLAVSALLPITLLYERILLFPDQPLRVKKSSFLERVIGWLRKTGDKR